MFVRLNGIVRLEIDNAERQEDGRIILTYQGAIITTIWLDECKIETRLEIKDAL